MTKKYKILLGLLLLLLSVFFALQIDDNILPHIEDNYQKITSPDNTSNAYTYLLGMQASTNDKPELVGYELLKSLRKFEKNYSTDGCKKQVDFERYPVEKTLPHLELGSCDNNSCETIDLLFSYKFSSNNISFEQQVLLQRYNKFLSFKDYQTLAIPNAGSPIPSFRYIIDGSNLVNLLAIDSANNKDYMRAKKLLLDNISALRIYLKQADTLIAKIIFTTAISKNLDVLSILRTKYAEIHNIVIEPLNNEERNLVKAMNYESGFTYNTSKEIANCSDYMYKKFKIPKWLYRTMYKPNITINTFHKEFREIANESLLSNEKFTNITTIKPLPIFNIRNLIGSYSLAFNTAGNFHPYIARVFSLDSKIQIFNRMGNPAVNLINIKNPFYPLKKIAYLNKKKNSVCFEVPTLTKSYESYKCLRIK